MAIKSMTGFARSEGGRGAVQWVWEARSVNGRGLDLRLRLPPGYDALEPKIREAAGKRFSRGSINIALNVKSDTAASVIRLNHSALEQVLAAADRVRQLGTCELPRADGLLALRGVLEVVDSEDDADEVKARGEAMLVDLERALSGLTNARASEGGRLSAVLADQLGEVERLSRQIAASPARTPEAIKARLLEQIARLMETGQSFDPARLHQEAVLIATRADVEEELKRLASHVAAAREMLALAEPVGRKLDFLAQEFNREANTLCSKAGDTDMVRAGLALKVVIDQMREQVQNIE